MKNLRIQYFSFSGLQQQKSKLFQEFFRAYVQFQDFTGPAPVA